MERGGKRSATPLLDRFIGIQSAGAASLCRRTPNGEIMSAAMKSEPGAVATGLNLGDTQ